MSQSNEIDQPYKGQKFASFEHLKKYLEEYGQKNFVKFWIRSSHTRNSRQKAKISKTMNPDLKYVSVKFACIFGGEKIRCRGSGIRKSYTYRNLGCPCTISAVVGEDGNHVKLDNVILEHNHALCKTLYDSLKRTRGKILKSYKDIKESEDTCSKTDLELVKNANCQNEIKVVVKKEWLSNMNNSEVRNEEKSETGDNSLQDIEDKYGKIVKILVVNSEEAESEQPKKQPTYDEIDVEVLDLDKDKPINSEEICRLCLSSKEKLSPIFNPSLPLESTVLSFKIMGCASIEISSDDGLPNNICTTCEANLDIAYNFRIRCEKSDSILRETYAKGKSVIGVTEAVENLEEQSCEETLIVFKEDGTKLTTVDEIRPIAPPPQEPLYIQFAISCPLCSSEFETYESMLEHLGSHTDDETLLLACNMCSVICSSVKELREHMEKHLKETENETWACGTCGTTFTSEDDLKAHELNHEDSETLEKKTITEMKYLCNVCGKIFKTKDRFQAHKNIHEGLRPHICLQCGRGFADRKNLHQHHDVVHLRKVRHECPVCQRKFYTRTKMKSHMTMHSGVKPFACDVCNKTFRLKMNMNKHKKTHTNERPYQCDKCNAAFIEKNLLKRHSYKHGGVRPYRCPVCGHGFSAKFCLKKHLKDSKCRGLVIADPESYQWVGVGETETSLEDKKCVVVYKSEEDETLQGEVESFDLNLLQEIKDEAST